jgi:hypothetical protein
LTDAFQAYTFKSVRFDWDPDKNDWLRRNRNITFEEIALLLASGLVWKVTKHLNTKKFPNQHVFLVPVNDYIYFVPSVIEGDVIFLKTAFLHRQSTKMYLEEKQKDG